MSDDLFNLDEAIEQMKRKDSKGKEMKESALYRQLDETQREQILSLCQSKAEEFALIGYDNIDKEAIWNYFTQKYRNQVPPIHRLVNEILSLKVTTYMNWETINAYKGV